MSATIYYRPTKAAAHLSIGAPSSFMEILSDVFGGFPLRLNTEGVDRIRLTAMLAVAEGERKKAFQELLDAMDQYGEIEVYAEY